ncbi:MAG: LamG domain-containing protein [Candidatus Micrarchaeaceae archaeon]
MRDHLKTGRLLAAQSAMEYLMTYGWAILVIAVVLGALFQLGVFNPANFAPKAPPGACQVSRPNGPGTTQVLSTVGECNELPEYVGKFASSSQVRAITNQVNTSAGGYNTVTFWMKWNNVTNEIPFSFTSYSLWIASPTCFGFSTGNGDAYGISPAGLSGYWVFVAAEFYNGPYTGNSILYINGVQQSLSQCSGTASSGAASTTVYISGEGSADYFTGEIADVQLYNVSLSAQEVQEIYNYGIGGEPVYLQKLAGWWPLNGNANDYSGNENAGTASGVGYVNDWQSGYTKT